MIDEELRMPQGSDVTFVKKLQTTHKASPHFANVLQYPEHFLVRHYAYVLRSRSRLVGGGLRRDLWVWC